MAKIMVSFPDELLASVDELAKRKGTTRSGLLQWLAERELETEASDRANQIEQLLAMASPQGGNSVELLREDRRSH